MPKHAIASARVTKHGIEGDKQKNLKYHGGPDRAVCLFSTELYARLKDLGIDLANGAVGENFTTTGLDLDTITPGDRLRVGECLIEITDVRIPCRSLIKLHPNLLKQMQGHSGWVAKVIEEAIAQPGDAIIVHRTERYHPAVLRGVSDADARTDSSPSTARNGT